MRFKAIVDPHCCFARAFYALGWMRQSARHVSSELESTHGRNNINEMVLTRQLS